MASSANQPQQKPATTKMGSSKIIMLLYILGNLIFSYQLFIMLGDLAFRVSDMVRIPVLTNRLVPLALVVACILLCVSKNAQTYNVKAAVTMFIVAVVCYILPSLLLPMLAEKSPNLITPVNFTIRTTEYFCVAFGFISMYMEPGNEFKAYTFASLAFPCMMGIAILIAKPEYPPPKCNSGLLKIKTIFQGYL